MKEPYRLVHLSDLHIGKRAKETRRARRLVEWIACHHPGARVLVTGDLTESGRRSQCQSAAAILDQLAESNPVLTVPGNHDYGFFGLAFQHSCWENYYRHLARPLGRWPRGTTIDWLNLDDVTGLGVLVDGPVAFFGLDSRDPDNHEVCARGYISRRLASLLTAVLAKPAYVDKTRVVLLHHHPFKSSLLTALHGTRRLLTAVKAECELLLFGHHHHFGIWWHRNLVPMTVGSHKSTDRLVEDLLGVGIVDIRWPGTSQTDLEFRMEAAERQWHVAA
jgi:3',5'-cyclic AMP phosphodiesterase CpdA